MPVFKGDGPDPRSGNLGIWVHIAGMMRVRWNQLAVRLGLCQTLLDEVWDVIETKYGEAHRCYHTLAHLEDMLTKADELGGLIADRDAVDLATYFHDIIYDPLSRTNEEDSADLFSSLLGDHLPAALTAKVHLMILATKQHSCDHEADQDVRYFLDLDMSILSSSEQRYAEYAAEIRQEYIAFDDSAYREGRAKVLEGFLTADKPIFATQLMRDRHEAAARGNLQHELRLLQQQQQH